MRSDRKGFAKTSQKNSEIMSTLKTYIVHYYDGRGLILIHNYQSFSLDHLIQVLLKDKNWILIHDKDNPDFEIKRSVWEEGELYNLASPEKTKAAQTSFWVEFALYLLAFISLTLFFLKDYL